MRLASLYRELVVRRVFRTLALYVIAAWLVLQVADTVFPGIGLPDWAIRYVLIAALAGVPVAVFFAWFFQITPTGLVRSRGGSTPGVQQSLQRSDYLILLLFLIVISIIAYSTVTRLSEVPALSDRIPETPLIGKNSLAVLAFTSQGEGEAGEILAAGLTEALTNALVRTPGLDVVARGAAERLSGQNLSPQDAARTLGAAYVLQGSVRLNGDTLHVAAELVEGRTGLSRWSQTYDQTASGILPVQGDIARQLTSILASEGAAAEPAAAVQTRDPAAFEAYSRGRFFWNQRTPEGLKRARGYFEEAVSLDPDYALAWSGLADVFVSLYDYGEMSLDESTEQATSAIDRAFSLDPMLAAAHNSRAHLDMHLWRWSDAEAEFERAIELDPGYAPAYHWHALSLTAIGRLDLAVAAMKKAQALDPLSVRINADLGMALFAARAYDEAIKQEKRTLEISPEAAVAWWVIGMANAAEGNDAEAYAGFDEALSISPDDPAILGSLGYTYAHTGQADEARAIIDKLAKAGEGAPPDAFFIALVYAGLDDRPQALDQLERAVREHSGSVRYLKIDSRLDNLRAEPRFKALLAEVGL